VIESTPPDVRQHIAGKWCGQFARAEARAARDPAPLSLGFTTATTVA
jgi:hypothetical protein